MEKIQGLNSRFREVLRDTLIENSRRNGFIRIYPTRNTEIFDQYFSQPKPLHKFVHKALFTDEFIPFQPAYPSVLAPRKTIELEDNHAVVSTNK